MAARAEALQLSQRKPEKLAGLSGTQLCSTWDGIVQGVLPMFCHRIPQGTEAISCESDLTCRWPWLAAVCPASQVLGCGYVLMTTASLFTSNGLCPLQTGFSLPTALSRNGSIKTFTMFFEIQLTVAIHHGSADTAFPGWTLHYFV